MALSTGDAEPEPAYRVFLAGAHSVRCYRAVSANPAPPTDFLSHLQLAEQFAWWDLHRAAGVSAWINPEKAVALARRKGGQVVAEIDLARADPRTPWAQTGHPEHITIWAPPPVILQAVVAYADMG